MGERLRGEVWGWGRVKRDKHAAHRKFLSLHRQSIPCPSPAQIHAVKTDQGSITLTKLKVDTSMLELVIKWVQSLKDFLLFLAFSFSFFFLFPRKEKFPSVGGQIKISVDVLSGPGLWHCDTSTV